MGMLTQTAAPAKEVLDVPGDNAVGAASGWQVAEFNIFGDGGNNTGGGQASFNSGATLVPRTRRHCHVNLARTA